MFIDFCPIIEALGQQHDSAEWRWFINSLKVSFKAVLLLNGNKSPFVPLAYAVNMAES